MKRLERSRSNRILAGVCGGFGEYFRLDPDIVRVIWIAAGLCGGIGVIPYVVAIFLLPEGEETREVQKRAGGTRILGLGLIAVAGLFLLRAFDVGWFGAGVFAFWNLWILSSLVLLVAGALLVWPRARDTVGFAGGRKPRRSVSDRVLAGVAGGIASELGKDANLIRLAFVLATVITSGFAALIYVLLIVILPEEELDRPVTAGASPPIPPVAPVPVPPAPASPPEPPPASPSPGPAAPVVDPAGAEETTGEQEPLSEAQEPFEAPDTDDRRQPEPGAESAPDESPADEPEGDQPDQDTETDRR